MKTASYVLVISCGRFEFREYFTQEDVEPASWLPTALDSIQIENWEAMEALNGKHILYGIVEALYQSDYIPPFLYDLDIHPKVFTWERL